MRRVPSTALAVLSLALSLISASALAFHYRVSLGDTLSRIAKKNFSGPVYGSAGSLKKIIAFNPMTAHSPDLIFPGQLLMISPNENKSPEPLAEGLPTHLIPAGERKIASAESSPDQTQLPESRADLELKPDYAFTGISVTDRASGASVGLPSAFNAGVTGTYYQDWTDTFKTLVRFRIGYLSFSQISGGNVTDPNHLMTSFGIGGQWLLNEKSKLEVSANESQEAFGAAASYNQITIYEAAIPNLTGKLSYNLYQKNPYTIGISALAAVNFPGSVPTDTIRLGQSFGGNLYLRQRSVGGGKMSYQTEIGILTRSQNTDRSQIRENDITLGLRIFFNGETKAAAVTKDSERTL